VDEGVLIPQGQDQIRLTRAFLFESPSAAASVLSGGNKNGRTEWRDSAGRTLKQLQEQTASSDVGDEVSRHPPVGEGNPPAVSAEALLGGS
jgi:hypothetical protein